MAHYGEILDSNYFPDRDNIYSIIIQYFGDLTMTKIKDVNEYSMYAAKIYCLLSNQNRYVIVFTPNDRLPIGNTEQLRNIQWVTLQTRSLQDNHGIPAQTYKPRRMKELMERITLRTKDEHAYTYDCEKYPNIEITLLVVKKGELEYQPIGNMVTAIETYNTIISFKI